MLLGDGPRAGDPGVRAVQQYLVDEVQRVYRDQGVVALPCRGEPSKGFRIARA